MCFVDKEVEEEVDSGTMGPAPYIIVVMILMLSYTIGIMVCLIRTSLQPVDRSRIYSWNLALTEEQNSTNIQINVKRHQKSFKNVDLRKTDDDSIHLLEETDGLNSSQKGNKDNQASPTKKTVADVDLYNIDVWEPQENIRKITSL